MSRALLAIAVGVSVGAAFHLLVYALAPIVLSSPPSERTAYLFSFAFPAISLMLSGVVSAILMPQHWATVSAVCGAIGTALLLWFFDAAGYWFILAAVFVVGLVVSLAGGFLGKHIPKRVIDAP